MTVNLQLKIETKNNVEVFSKMGNIIQGTVRKICSEDFSDSEYDDRDSSDMEILLPNDFDDIHSFSEDFNDTERCITV